MATINYILQRIEAKKADYEEYGFTLRENDAFKTFFDLAQEFDSTEDFCKLCVAIPLGFFGQNSRMFLVSRKDSALVLAASTDEDDETAPPSDLPTEQPLRTERNSVLFTIRGNVMLLNQLPFKTTEGLLGLLEVSPAERLTSHHEFFLEKYANRIGYNMHNRFILEKNIEHVRFIKRLVADIEHNVIAPNMVYRLFLRNLKSKINMNAQLETKLSRALSAEVPDRAALEDVLSDLSEVNHGLDTELQNMERHYSNMSLFLETLLRRSHFDHGRLMLRTKKCNIRNEVLEPQLEQYRERFERMGIGIDDRTSGIPEEEDVSVVDVGLIAQVYANLFSNALKYTQAVRMDNGEERKLVSYGRELIRDYFGPARDGVKYNVFSTGPHISPEETPRIFDEGYRGRATMDRPGSGHGLAFIKNVLELHNGVAGYEATRFGNNFFFILPR